MSELSVVVAGAGGRMGLANIRAIAATPGTRLRGALEREGAPALGRDAGVLAGLEASGIAVTADWARALDGADAVLDFSTPAASRALARETARRGLAHVIGTTGCSPDDEAAFRAAAGAGARIVKSGNFSVGVNLLASLVRQAAALLPGFDIEILEAHHKAKVDAPSGTALLLGHAAAEGRGVALDDVSVRARDGHTGPREAGTIGFQSLRGGTVVGDHRVMLLGPSERIELVHHAEDRALFAHGALRAALWAATRPKGFYTMADVLGLE